MWACLACLCRSNHLSCCEVRNQLLLFFTYSFIYSETCFPRIYCLNSSSWVCRLTLVVFLVDLFLVLISQLASCMLDKHFPSTMMCMHQLQNLYLECASQ